MSIPRFSVRLVTAALTTLLLSAPAAIAQDRDQRADALRRQIAQIQQQIQVLQKQIAELHGARTTDRRTQRRARPDRVANARRDAERQRQRAERQRAQAQRRAAQQRRQAIPPQGRDAIRRPQVDPRAIAREQQATRLRAVQRELHAALQAGKMTPEQAREKMMAIRKQMAAGREQAARRAPQRRATGEQRLMAVGRRLEAAVKAGELTQAEARQMMAVLKKGAAVEQKQERPKTQPKRREAPKRKETAKRKEAPKRKETPNQQKQLQAQQQKLGAVRKKLMAEVKAGKLTKEQAAEKLAELKKQAGAAKKKAAAEKKKAKKAAKDKAGSKIGEVRLF